MKNKIAKTIGVLSVASLMSTSAFSQITISGYAEVGMLTGSNKGARAAASSKGLGSEFLVQVAGKGTLSNGWTFTGYQNFDTDEVGNGVDSANSNPMTTRALEISPSKDFKLFYTYDGVYGGEIARTAVPVVTERVADLTGNTTINGAVYRYSGQTVVGGTATNLTAIDVSSSRTYLIQMIPTNVEATTNYRIFGVIQVNATSGSYAFTTLSSQTMDITFSGSTVQARVTNGQQWTFNWSITQLL